MREDLSKELERGNRAQQALEDTRRHVEAARARRTDLEARHEALLAEHQSLTQGDAATTAATTALLRDMDLSVFGSTATLVRYVEALCGQAGALPTALATVKTVVRGLEEGVARGKAQLAEAEGRRRELEVATAGMAESARRTGEDVARLVRELWEVREGAAAQEELLKRTERELVAARRSAQEVEGYLEIARREHRERMREIEERGALLESLRAAPRGFREAAGDSREMAALGALMPLQQYSAAEMASLAVALAGARHDREAVVALLAKLDEEAAEEEDAYRAAAAERAQADEERVRAEAEAAELKHETARLTSMLEEAALAFAGKEAELQQLRARCQGQFAHTHQNHHHLGSEKYLEAVSLIHQFNLEVLGLRRELAEANRRAEMLDSSRAAVQAQTDRARLKQVRAETRMVIVSRDGKAAHARARALARSKALLEEEVRVSVLLDLRGGSVTLAPAEVAVQLVELEELEREVAEGKSLASQAEARCATLRSRAQAELERAREAQSSAEEAERDRVKAEAAHFATEASLTALRASHQATVGQIAILEQLERQLPPPPREEPPRVQRSQPIHRSSSTVSTSSSISLLPQSTPKWKVTASDVSDELWNRGTPLK
jgi:hypothetical protein